MTRVVLNKAAPLPLRATTKERVRERRAKHKAIALLKRTTFAALFSFFFFLFGFTFYLIRRIRMMLWKLSKLATGSYGTRVVKKHRNTDINTCFDGSSQIKTKKNIIFVYVL